MKKNRSLTEPQKTVLTTLRRNPGSYMKKTINHGGTEKYKVFDKEKNPIAWASKADVVHLSNLALVQWNENGTITLNEQGFKKYFQLSNAPQ